MAETERVILQVELDQQEAEKRQETLTRAIRKGTEARKDLNKSIKANNDALKIAREAGKGGEKAVRELVAQNQKFDRSINQINKNLTNQRKEQRLLNKAQNAGTTTIVGLRNRLSQLTDEYNKTRIGSKRFRELQKEVRRTSDEIKRQEKAVGDARRNVGNYPQAITKNFALLATGIAAGIGVLRRFTSGISASVEAFGEQEAAQKKLEVALGGVSNKLLEQASALQEQTKFGDEAIISGQAFLAQMGQTEEQIKSITPAVLDFAEAQGISVNDAFKLVAKSVGSSTNALTRYGVAIEGTVGSSERTESAIKNLTNAFGGQATAAAQIGTGPLQQLKNTFGDLQENVGEFIIKGSAPLIKSMKTLTERVKNFIDPAETQAEILSKQQVEMNLLVGRITDTNVKEAERKGLIDELNRVYPELLANLDEEKVSNEELTAALGEFNLETSKRIAFEQEKERLTEAVTERIQRQNAVTEQQAKLERLLIKAAQDRGILDQLQNKNQEERIDLIRRTGVGLGQGIKILEDIELAQTKLNRATDEEAEVLSDVKDIITSLGITREEANKGLAENTNLKNENIVATVEQKTALQLLNEEIAKTTAQLELQALAGEIDTALLNKLIVLTDRLAKAESDLTFQLQLQRSVRQGLNDGQEETIKLLEEEDAFIDPADLAAQIEEIEGELTVTQKLFGLSDEEQAQLEEQAIQSGTTIATAFADAAAQIRKQDIANQLAETKRNIDTESKAKIKGLNDQLKANLISQEEFDSKVASIEETAAKRKLEADKKAFEQNKRADISAALIKAALAVVSSLALTTLPFPTSLAGPATIAGVTAAEIAIIASKKFTGAKGFLLNLFGNVTKAANGLLMNLFGGATKAAKGGIFGGKPHSQGGTKGVFDDGTQIEVERGELFAVVNAKDTARIAALNDANSVNGKPFFSGGGAMKFQDGGFAAQSATASIDSQAEQASQIADAVANITPVVTVEDINAGQQSVAEVEQRANIS